MYPHERSLVKRMKDKPFALLGIDYGDSEKPEMLRRLVNDGTITWRFWIDLPPGRIKDRYRIQGFPTLILLDQRGIIRATDLRDPDEIDALIDALLQEMEGEKKTS
jgi:hypothetical protein